MRSSNEEIYLSMGISKTVYDYGCTIEKSLRDRFDEVDSNAEYNQLKVVNAMQQHQVSEACLLGTTGYGYNDLGRDTLEAVYAATFHKEDALLSLLFRFIFSMLFSIYLEKVYKKISICIKRFSYYYFKITLLS